MGILLAATLCTLLCWFLIATVIDLPWLGKHKVLRVFVVALLVAFLGWAAWMLFRTLLPFPNRPDYDIARYLRDYSDVFARMAIGIFVALAIVVWLYRHHFNAKDPDSAQRRTLPILGRVDPTLDAKWAVPILAAAVLFAIFLPHIDRIIRNLEELKVGSLELKMATQQSTGEREQIKHLLESNSLGYIKMLLQRDMVLRALESDKRMAQLRLAKKPAELESAKEAINAFRDYYVDVVYPVLACVNHAIDQGVDINVLRVEVGRIEQDLALAMSETRKAQNLSLSAQARNGAESLAQVAAKRATEKIRELAKLERCTELEGVKGKLFASLTASLRARLIRSGWTHFIIAALYGFTDNPVQGARYLEDIPEELRGLLAQQALIGFWDALELRDRAIELTESGLKEVKEYHALACNRAGADAGGEWAKDVDRLESQLVQWNNNLAYLVARSAELRSKGTQAFASARYALDWLRPGSGLRACPGVQLQPDTIKRMAARYDGVLDTFAYLVLASEVGARSPKFDRIACAHKVFEASVDRQTKKLNEFARTSLTRKDGRLNFELERVMLNILQGHAQLAAQALGHREASCPMNAYLEFSEGKLGPD